MMSFALEMLAALLEPGLLREERKSEDFLAAAVTLTDNLDFLHIHVFFMFFVFVQVCGSLCVCV